MWCSVVLLLAHIAIQGGLSTKELGLRYNLTARDDNKRATGVLAGRAERALRNFLETYPAFIVLAALGLLGPLSKTPTGSIETVLVGANVWLWGRSVYLLLYLRGIPGARTLVWAVSAIGLGMMAFGLYPAIFPAS